MWQICGLTRPGTELPISRTRGPRSSDDSATKGIDDDGGDDDDDDGG